MRVGMRAAHHDAYCHPQPPAAAVVRAPGFARRVPRDERRTKKRPAARSAAGREKLGGNLLSREVALRVPSALAGLTSLFGMGRGVSPPLLPPKVVGRGAHTLKTP